MNERQAFLAAINENLADDFPRLQFADWLDERGDPLGEFIRVQIRLHHEGRTDDRETRPDKPYSWAYDLTDSLTLGLYKRCVELITGNKDQWTVPVSSWVDRKWSRGFPGYLEMDADDWNKSADAILAVHPVEVVRLRDRVRGMEQRVLTIEGYFVGNSWRYPGREWVNDGDAREPIGVHPYMQSVYWPKIRFI